MLSNLVANRTSLLTLTGQHQLILSVVLTERRPGSFKSFRANPFLKLPAPVNLLDGCGLITAGGFGREGLK